MVGAAQERLGAAEGCMGLAEGPDQAVGLEQVSAHKAMAGRVVHSPQDAVGEHMKLVEGSDQAPGPEEAGSS